MSGARVRCSVSIAALVTLLASACACSYASADPPSWRLEPVLPPQQSGESDEQHLARPPIGIGKIGDIEFFAPNRGVLITEGNPPSIPAGVWAYDGHEWHELSDKCGATDGRIAWAGPDEFWTVSDGRPGQASGERPPPLQDNTLCHFKNGAIVGSYASLAFRPDSYQAMHAAACLSPSDCWFGGDELPEAEPGARTEFGAFQLHFNGSSVTEQPYPAEHAIEDLRPFGGYLFESVRLLKQDRLQSSESLTAPPDLHLITPIGVQPTFISLTPGVPQYAPEEHFYSLDFLHLASDAEALWGAADPVRPTIEEQEEGAPPAEVTILRYAEGQWTQVLGAGTDPPGGNPLTQAGREEGENETVSSIAAEPGDAANAWLALNSQNNTARGVAATAMVGRISSAGELSERQTLPAVGEGVGAKGAADKIVCPAPNDCWLATTQGWLFHYADSATRELPKDSDPAFSSLITFRPADAGIPAIVPDAPPVDDSGLSERAPGATGSLLASVAPEPELRVPVALLSRVRTKLVHGTTLDLRFHLAVRSRVRLIAKRGKRVVASTPTRTFSAGDRRVLLVLNRRRWPTKLDLQTHALAPLPTTSTRGAATDTVGTGVVALPKARSFRQAGSLP
jgi:hypothetical protein